MTHKTIQQALQSYADPIRAKHSKRYFKTGKGEYGEGDVFIGVTNPNQKKVAKQFYDTDFASLEKLLYSKIHEYRQVALFILVHKYQKADEKEKRRVVTFYKKHRRQVNNWDLVDLSAHKILGEWLVDKDRSILYKYAKSKNLWEKRIAIIATAAFIKRNDFQDTLVIAELLLRDSHDLIHKAVGWMLREVGNADKQTEVRFLNKHAHHMPRTMLRYAIEKFPEPERKKFLALGK